MTRIYIVRHCEAMGNVLRIFQGTTDLDISELGGIQLKYLEKYFENMNNYFNLIKEKNFSNFAIATQVRANANKIPTNATIEKSNPLIKLIIFHSPLSKILLL